MAKRRQEKAFLMFGRGRSPAEVSRELGISYKEAQHLKVIYLKTEEVSDSDLQEATEFYERRIAEEKKQAVEQLLREVNDSDKIRGLKHTGVCIICGRIEFIKNCIDEKLGRIILFYPNPILCVLDDESPLFGDVPSKN